MSGMDIKDVAKTLKDIDFVMLNTHTDGGQIAGRPMSNNRDVEYDGDSWFFVDEESRTFADVSANPKVTLSAQGSKGLLGKPPIFLSVEGEVEIVKDKAILAEHWNKDLERWWPEGPETPGVALLKVHATRIHYWDGEDEGEVPVP
ncbi:pyridoxamine 5'-phosphate oxidase family protein [Caulobacter sp. NIBR2454]|uniref:pyridoxamine 5'-phosphate oxidase family protein n=1 Tax=Caulobacter sp. NIBR2454 TaxID=3015996 RepID=UPI0022B6F145|nr:pyridoxamine 5'-phosphate oxidase family protein [Caulobacter sp. NIBR2454]